jgi:protein-disulfide isomerase
MRLQKQALGAVVALGLMGCVTRGEIEDIKKGQADILAKLDKIEKSGGGGRMPPPQAPQGPDPAKVYAFPVGESPMHGQSDAWVTIVEVSDFQCPFCGRAVATLKQIEDTYKDDVRIVFKHNPLPFHQRAMPAALAAECAHEQNKFWPLHDKMFADQTHLEDKDLEGYAKGAGINVDKWKKCLTDPKVKSRIEGDQALANKLGARGTPAFFINGRFLSGAQPFPAFKTIIDEELKKAQGSGINKKEYYAKVVEEKGEKAM